MTTDTAKDKRRKEREEFWSELREKTVGCESDEQMGGVVYNF